MSNRKETHSVLWICVNYNTYEQTYRLIRSIIEAAFKPESRLKIDLIVADNSNPWQQISAPPDLPELMTFRQVITQDNLGYFGAVRFAFQQLTLDGKKYDFTIISNVDVQPDGDFFRSLISTQCDDETGMIAPSILSMYEHIDKNPAIKSRPSRRKMLFYQVLYSYPLFYQMFLGIRKVYLFIRVPGQPAESNSYLYSTHGSLMIILKSFFARGGEINYPVFLYGEELYLAEELRNRSLKTIYAPAVKVLDDEHVNTSEVAVRRLCKWSLESIKFIRKNYYGKNKSL